jgi:hypothetical protein
MAKRSGDQLRRGDRVTAAHDLVGVPAGTPGRIDVVNGFRWTRYWVTFENGVHVGSVDRGDLVHVDKRGEPVA